MSGALHAEKVEHVKLDLVWDMNPTAGVYTNKNTGVSFTQNIAGFKGHNAYPLAKDGIANFEYRGQNGMLNIHLAHRAAVNLPKQANYSTPFFKNCYSRTSERLGLRLHPDSSTRQTANGEKDTRSVFI